MGAPSAAMIRGVLAAPLLRERNGVNPVRAVAQLPPEVKYQGIPAQMPQRLKRTLGNQDSGKTDKIRFLESVCPYLCSLAEANSSTPLRGGRLFTF